MVRHDLPFGKSVVSVSNHFLPVLRNGLHEDSVQTLKSDNQPVTPWIDWFAFFEDGYDIYLPPVAGGLPQSPQPFKDDRKQIWKDVGHLSQHLG